MAISQDDADAMAQLLPVSIRIGREIRGYEKYACYPAPVQVIRKLFAVYPRRANQLKRGVGAAPDAHVCAFHQTSARIQGGLGEGAKVWGGADPFQAGVIV